MNEPESEYEPQSLWNARLCATRFEGKAIANALQIVHLLRHQPVNVPDPMLAHFPELEAISSSEPPASVPIPAPEPHQTDLLFGTPVGAERKD